MKRKFLSLLTLLLATGSLAMAQTSTFKTDFKEQRNVATFALTGISGTSVLKDATKTNVKLTGDLTLHGVTKKISVPATLTYFKQNENTKSKLAGNLLKANVRFNIKMSDYGVKVPSMMLMKVSNDVKITLDYVATDDGANAAMNPCNPCNPCSIKKDMKSKNNPCAPQKNNPCAPKKQ